MLKPHQVTILREWHAALVSGKYKQGRKWLKKTRDGNVRYCCLGVLQKIRPELTQEEDAELLSEDSWSKVTNNDMGQDEFACANDTGVILDQYNKSGNYQGFENVACNFHDIAEVIHSWLQSEGHQLTPRKRGKKC